MTKYKLLWKLFIVKLRLWCLPNNRGSFVRDVMNLLKEEKEYNANRKEEKWNQ